MFPINKLSPQSRRLMMAILISLMLLILGLLFLSETWSRNIKDFFQIWSWSQWVTSLISLIVMYWVTGHFYNKKLSLYGGWLSFETRVWLIAIDLTMNFAIGFYYMNYRDSAMGALMLTCPIALSPLIFILELVCVHLYYRSRKIQK